MNVLVAEPYVGEFGWTVAWAQHLNAVASERRYDRIVVFCRNGEEALFPFATEVRTFPGTPTHSVGHWFQKGFVGEAPNPVFADAQRLVEQLRRRGDVVTFECWPRGENGKQHNPWTLRGVPYRQAPELVARWRSAIGPGQFAAVCIRAYARSAEKNLPGRERGLIQKACREIGLRTIGLGNPDAGFHEATGLDVDLQGRTTAADLIAIFSMCELAVGRSTGTLHLASACGVPHIVWMAKRLDYVKRRYESDWNALSAPVWYHHGIPSQRELSVAIAEVRERRSAMVSRDASYWNDSTAVRR